MAHAIPSVSAGESESDAEITNWTRVKMRFRPIAHHVARTLCEKLGVRDRSPARELGRPCKCVDTIGDGNCFFRAVSEALCGTDRHHQTIRGFVVNHLRRNPDVYTYTLDSKYSSVPHYLEESRMDKLGTWATAVEIQATADSLGVSIYTYYVNRWLEYKCRGEKLSEQGIYLRNRGAHYETVKCVQIPRATPNEGNGDSADLDEGALCYGYCKAAAGERSSDERLEYVKERMERLELLPEARRKAMAEVPPRKFLMRGEGKTASDSSDSENEAWGKDEEDSSGDDYSCYMDRSDSEEDSTGTDNIDEATLQWSLLNRTWHAFLRWLGERWWDNASEEDIASFLGKPEVAHGCAVVSAYFRNEQGGVLSCTVKEQPECSFDLLVRGGSYVYAKAPACIGFRDPIEPLKAVFGATALARFIARPEGLPSHRSYFSISHVTEQMGYMMELLGDNWWGAWRGNVNTLFRALQRAHENQTKNKWLYPCAILHRVDVDSLGYLFEILTADGRRFEVTFSPAGFKLHGTTLCLSEICSIIAYLPAENVTFSTRSAILGKATPRTV